MTPKEILKAAMALIERPGGWTKGALKEDGKCPGTHRFCAVGALREYELGTRASTQARKLLNEAASRAVRRPNFDVIVFNDSPKTRKADILRVFRSAIRHA